MEKLLNRPVTRVGVIQDNLDKLFGSSGFTEFQRFVYFTRCK